MFHYLVSCMWGRLSCICIPAFRNNPKKVYGLDKRIAERKKNNNNKKIIHEAKGREAYEFSLHQQQYFVL